MSTKKRSTRPSVYNRIRNPQGALAKSLRTKKKTQNENEKNTRKKKLTPEATMVAEYPPLVFAANGKAPIETVMKAGRESRPNLQKEALRKEVLRVISLGGIAVTNGDYIKMVAATVPPMDPFVLQPSGYYACRLCLAVMGIKGKPKSVMKALDFHRLIHGLADRARWPGPSYGESEIKS